jgi:hypothetical protein
MTIPEPNQTYTTINNTRYTVKTQWLHEDGYQWTAWKNNQTQVQYSARTDAFLSRYTLTLD